MLVIEGESELKLVCTETEGGLSVLRCETRDSIVHLPDSIGGRPVVALGDYVLAARAPDFSAREVFSVRVTCGGMEPVHDENAVRRVILPAGLERIGSYAFYNCRALESLEMTDSVREFGGGALMNCASLHEVSIAARTGAPTCLQKLLGEHAGELDVTLDYGRQRARLLFPAYSEELEDLSPAHIFQRRIHGAGYGYRQCFTDGVLQFAQYDNTFSGLLERHDFQIAARAAVRRLAEPVQLSAAARTVYLDCLRVHGGGLACALAEQGDSTGLTFLLSLHVLPPEEISAACDRARERGQTAALSVLLASVGGMAQKGRTKSFDL